MDRAEAAAIIERDLHNLEGHSEYILKMYPYLKTSEKSIVLKDVEAHKMALEALRNEPKSGHWISNGLLSVKCSACDDIFYELDAFNYCPNCGAKMDEEVSE